MASKKGLNTNSKDIKNFKKYIVPILEKQHVRVLIKHRDKFKEVWDKYCIAYKVDKEKLFDDKVMLKRASQCLATIKCKSGRITTTEADPDNHVMIHWTKQNKKNTKRKTNISQDQELEIVETTGITKRKIQSINFASDITVSTVKRVEQAAEFKRLFSQDYIYFLTGGTDETEKMPDGKIRKRFNAQLTHLKVSAMIRKRLQALSNQVINEIEKEGELSSDKKSSTMAELSVLNKLLDTTRKADEQPIDYLNKIEEGEFSAQKALQGAIMNDRTMIDNGQIVVEKEKELVVGQQNINEDLKIIGDAILDKQLENLN